MAQLVLCSSQNSAVFFLTARCHLMGILVFELSHLLLGVCVYIYILILSDPILSPSFDYFHYLVTCFHIHSNAKIDRKVGTLEI